MQEIIYKGIVFKAPGTVIGKINKYHSRTFDAKHNKLLEKRPCEICDNEKSIAHHEIYADYDNVRWLCRSHHRIIHELFKLKTIIMKENVKTLLFIPVEFSRKLDRYLIDLKDQNVNMTKVELILKLAQIGLLQEIKELKK